MIDAKDRALLGSLAALLGLLLAVMVTGAVILGLTIRVFWWALGA